MAINEEPNKKCAILIPRIMPRFADSRWARPQIAIKPNPIWANTSA
jgi:hypothetical protein